LDLHDLFFRFTLDSFTEIAFGKDLKILERYAAGERDPVPFAAAFDTAQIITDYRIVNPFWKWTEYLDGSRRTMNRCKKVMDDFAYQVIQERRQDPKSGEYNDLLSRFLNVKLDENGKPYSDQELRDIVMNMIIAGRDTTAQALSWMIYMLDAHPEVKERIRQEVKEVCGENCDLRNGEAPVYEDIQRMAFTKAVMSETLRLYPSVPKQAKTALQDDKLPDGTLVPGGSMIVWSSYVMGRNKELWGPDAEEFCPDRFLKDPNPSQYKYVSFNAGPRLCLGMNMAYLEAMTALTMILNEFDLELAVDRKNITYQNGLTLSMRTGLPVRVHRRK